MRISHLCSSVFICGSILFAGCKSAVQSGHNTALGGVDLLTMTDDMAMKITADPKVQAEFAANGPLKVVVEPVENEMTAEILTRGSADAFTGRVRSLLSKHAPNEFVWVMNRDAFYKMRNKELDFDLGPSPDAVNPQFALHAKFRSLTREDAKHRSSYYLCVYELTDLSRRRILWNGSYEVKKSAVKGFLD